MVQGDKLSLPRERNKTVIKKWLTRWHLRWMRAHPEEWMYTLRYEGGVVPAYGPPRAEDGSIIGSPVYGESDGICSAPTIGGRAGDPHL